MLNIPYIQQKLATVVSNELSQTLKTEIHIKKIDIGLLNRIIIDDLLLYDQQKSELVKITRFSAKFEILPLFTGKIRVNSIQLFGFNINLNKGTPSSDPNFQFIIDTFASKDSNTKETAIDLRVNSILIRRGKLSYNVLSEENTPGRFNLNHINLQNIIANISLKALQNDSANITIKRFSIEDESGLNLKKASLKFVANKQNAVINNFLIDLPASSLNFDTITFSYDSLEAFKDFKNLVSFSAKTLPSFITPRDLTALVPALCNFADPIQIGLDINGTGSHLNINQAIINSKDNLQFEGNITLQDIHNPREAFIFGQISNLSLSKNGINFIFRNLTESGQTPNALANIDYASFKGEISGYFTDLVTYGLLKTSVGSVKTDLKLSTNSSNHKFSYSGSIKTENLNVGHILNNPQLGETAFNIEVKGEHLSTHKPDILLKGLISSFEFKNYKYENIYLDGEYIHGGFNGKASINDLNGAITINGLINFEQKVPTFDFTASIKDFNPNRLNLTNKFEDAKISVDINANFQGKSIDNITGTINIDSLYFETPEKVFFMNNLNLTAKKREKQNILSLNSEFLKASIEGNYKYQTIPYSIKNILYKYTPSLFPTQPKLKESNNNFNINIQLINTDILEIFDIPLTIYTPSVIKGNINDNTHNFRLEGYFPRLRYKNNFIESGMFLCANTDNNLNTKIRFTNRKKNDSFNVSVGLEACDDQVQTTIDWGNNAVNTYSGKLSALATFFRNKEEKTSLNTIINIEPTNVILNDTVWNIHKSHITIIPNKISVSDFRFSHNDRHLYINGDISNTSSDSIIANLKDINIAYVFDIADISDDVNFAGDATGKVYANNLFNKPIINAQLNIKDFALNNALLGNLNIYGAWNNEDKGIFLDAHIKGDEAAETFVKGYIYPLKPTSGLDLQIDAKKLNIQFIEQYMNSIATDLKGNASGKVHFYGKFKELTLNGNVMTNATLKFDFLNTTFAVNDTISLHPIGIDFNKVKIGDTEGHSGIINGNLRYNHFKDIQYHLDIQVNNMLLMNTHETPDLPFYGTVYGTGNALLTGNAQSGLNANVAITTNRNTIFNYTIGAAAVATSNQFIAFIDKTPRRQQDSIQITTYFDEIQNKEIDNNSVTDIRLNLLIDATPDATMRIIMDPATDDYISCKGAGNIRTEFYNKGDVKLFGNYKIQQGIYKFSIQEVIRKDFIIKDGSTITFNGPPLNANLDIQASYAVTSASLSDLIPDASSIIQQPNVKVNCMMNLTGVLLHPTVKLDISLPNERDEIQTLVRNYISTEEQMNMQILYLLGIGKFYMENNTGTRQSDMMSSVLSSTLSGQLNNLLSQIIDNNNWNIGTNLSTGEKGWTDVEVEGILSGQLLNNRLLINGNFGYRDNPMSNTNFVGDFEAEWLLNKSGDIRLKAYNETNDRYYTKTNLTTQGIGILFKKDFNRWNDLFFWNKWRLKRIEKERKLKEKEKKEDYDNTQSSHIKLKRNLTQHSNAKD